MLVREKTAGDAASCSDLLLQVNQADGYPVPLPVDLKRWLTPPHEIASWVAEQGGRITGHVALHAALPGPVLEAVQQATDEPHDRLAFLSRLFTSPQCRRAGVGRALLRHATSEAHARGLRLALDVGRNQAAPIALYESERWQRVQAIDVPVGDVVLVLWVYVAPLKSPLPA